MVDVFASIDDLVRPTLDEQHPKRRRQLLKNTIGMMSTLSATYVTRLSAAEVTRILSDRTDDQDPLKVGLSNLRSIFSDCEKNGIDVQDSVKHLLNLHSEQKGVHSTVLMAWRKKHNQASPQLVGVATCCTFMESHNISTLPQNLGDDYDELKLYFDKFYYIDTLCVKQPAGKGAGKILTLSALDVAYRRNKTGLIGFSFAGTDDRTPKSFGMFEKLGFVRLFPKRTAITVPETLYGDWFVSTVLMDDGKPDPDQPDWENVDEKMLKLCTRTGLTAKTDTDLMWRCPS